MKKRVRGQFLFARDNLLKDSDIFYADFDDGAVSMLDSTISTADNAITFQLAESLPSVSFSYQSILCE